MNTIPINETDHVSICVCTYRRPGALAALLERIAALRTAQFCFSVVVIDNDPDGSARPVVVGFQARSGLTVSYECEPENNIARARNRAITVASGPLVAFIDDDETPGVDWLRCLVTTMRRTGADAVLGPVEPSYHRTPPRWLERSGLGRRPRFPTGTRLAWRQTRTGNVLLRKRSVERNGAWFDAAFGVLGGEDIMFFKRLLARGCVAVWDDDAVVHELVTPNRMTFSWTLRRAFLQGHISFHYFKDEMTFFLRVRVLARCLAAMFCYAPIAALVTPFGIHRGARYLVKLTHHLSRGLTALGLRLVTERPA